MGCHGAICVFDHDRYLREVVPAFRAGATHPLIALHLAPQQAGRPWFEPGEFDALASVMTAFDDALLPVVPGQAPRRDDAGPCSYWRLCELFERVVTHHCISEYAGVGRAYRATYHLSRDWGRLGVDDTTEACVRLLDSRARYWTHGGGGFGEGIHGWLTAEETARFALGLDQVAPDPEEEPEPWEARRRLGEIRRVVASARAQQRGVLWGGDLEVLYRPESFPHARAIDA